jgi:hypothetical protein
MAFSIEFLDEDLIFPFEDASTPAAVGRLRIGDWSEEFFSSLHQWTTKHYESQWKGAISTLLGEKCDRAALITEYLGPDVSGHLQWWPMYKHDDIVYIQNQLLFYDQLSTPFRIDKPYASLRDRRVVDEDGQEISEWSVAISEVRKFAETFRLEEKEG